MLDAAVLIPALPLAGFVVLVLLGRRLGEPLAGWVGTAAAGGAFAATLVTFAGLLGQPGGDRVHTRKIFEWVVVGGLQVDVALLVDPLSVTMALFVTGVGTLIHLYSVGYMHGDPGFARFFTYLNLFMLSMLLLVLADNFLLSFLGWEGVGACSYFLISFWFSRESAAVAGKKAFVTNRVGDVGFMIAMFLVFSVFGSLTYLDVLPGASGLAEGTATAIALCLFLGACGKSAQLPLYVWLPDAMEGPTPVSALIHAATMVTSGVYLMVRTAPILVQSGTALTVIAVVGAATALFAATVACAQNDIKKVLAYSTVSQLGYMFLAVGSGAYVAAIFHMVTHAFFKALMFLGAGSVIHGLHDEQDMKRMGNLRRFMPVTWFTFMIGWLAIAGIPPFAGFWSKDEILLGAWTKSPVLWGVGALTALLTAYYMTRQVVLVFYGGDRWKQAGSATPEPALVGASTGDSADAAVAGTTDASAVAAVATGGHDDHGPDGHDGHPASHGEPHESPWTMTTPLVVLAVASAVGGLLNLPFGGFGHALEHWLEPALEGAGHHASVAGGTKLGLAVAAALIASAGVAVGWRTWSRRADNPGLEPPVLQRAWGVDRAYAAVVGGPGRAIADFSAFVVDKRGVDGAVNGLGGLFRAGGDRLRKTQTGYVRNYALGVAAGVAVLLGYVVARAGL